MFRRKEEEAEAMENNSNNNEVKKEAPASVSPTPAASAAVSQPVTPQAPKAQAPQQPASPYRPATPAPAARPQSFGITPQASTSGEEKGKRRILTVGNDILLKGEIATCDRLVIEGAVDAKLNDVHTVEIAETGSFKGSAEIEDAEISGLFEGDLIVRNRLIIYSTGKVRGKITYGEIEIERGGELTGEIRSSSSPVQDKKEKAA